MQIYFTPLLFVICRKEDGQLDELLYVNNCMLHGHTKALELAWLEFFGEFRIREHTVSLIYNIWYIQNRLKKIFHSPWKFKL